VRPIVEIIESTVFSTVIVYFEAERSDERRYQGVIPASFLSPHRPSLSRPRVSGSVLDSLSSIIGKGSSFYPLNSGSTLVVDPLVGVSISSGVDVSSALIPSVALNRGRVEDDCGVGNRTGWCGNSYGTSISFSFRDDKTKNSNANAVSTRNTGRNQFELYECSNRKNEAAWVFNFGGCDPLSFLTADRSTSPYR